MCSIIVNFELNKGDSIRQTVIMLTCYCIHSFQFRVQCPLPMLVFTVHPRSSLGLWQHLLPNMLSLGKDSDWCTELAQMQSVWLSPMSNLVGSLIAKFGRQRIGHVLKICCVSRLVPKGTPGARNPSIARTSSTSVQFMHSATPFWDGEYGAVNWS